MVSTSDMRVIFALCLPVGGWDRGHASAKKRYYHREDVMKITRKFSFLLSNDSKSADSDTGGEPVSQEWELRKTQIFNYMNQVNLSLYLVFWHQG